MSASFFRRPAARAFLIIGATIAACPALAGDKPATQDGAKKLQALFDHFLPATPAGGPAFVTVKSGGEDYLVSADLGALNVLLKAVGAAASYEPATLLYKLFEQDDGMWRLVQDSIPKIISHAGQTTSAIEIDNYKQTLVVDPALAWWVGGSASADKGVLALHSPKADETFDFGAVSGNYATTVNPDRTVSTSIKDEIDDIAFKITGAAKDGDPVNASGRLDKAALHIGADGLKTRKAFDLASLLSAHRDDLAEHEAELKGLLTEFAAPGLRLAEGGEISKLMVSSPYGAIALAALKLAIGVANAGPKSAIEATLAAEGLSLPVALAPPGAAALTPSKIDLTATLKGIDIAAGAHEAIADLRLGGPGPALSDEDSAKLAQAFLSAGPLELDLAPSHVVAPAIDADLQGAMRWEVGKPSGEMTIRIRGFDKTMAAVKALGPDVAVKSLPGLAMAKGLAKTERDGSLSWLVELGPDRSIKVNGIPLGRAPE
ncbi:MAG TPA: hypothetical protein VJY34_16640 [Roseiarcus sp.]|nr:hypothetical protein [Roseiarcus sp.]